ncbi:MAG: gliding motility-associated C-terminal domain-containing protein, partial [Bacteroidales bacterium]|nr:gliding motility-associated C-terminal domain-containing protein [Bacteroidales bacterium]
GSGTQVFASTQGSTPPASQSITNNCVAYNYQWSGGTTPTLNTNSFTEAGTYGVTVTNTANSCTNSSSITISLVSVPIVANVTSGSSTTIDCIANPNITLTANTNGENSPYTYLWSGGTPTNAVSTTINTSGTYTVTVYGTGGCTTTANLVIDGNTTPPPANITNLSGTTLIDCNTNASINVNSATPSDIIIGTGTSTTYTIPYNTFYNYAYSQQIYLGSEIGLPSGGTITAISFQYIYGTAQSPNPVSVYLGNISQANFSSTTDWVPLANLTEVYSGSVTFNNTGINYWVTITLQTPFTYTGGNLVVGFDSNWGTYQTGSSATFRYTTAPFNSSLYYYSDMTNPNPASPPIGLTPSTMRNNIKLSIAQNYSYAWNGGTTPNLATNTFTSGGTYIVTITNTETGCTNSANITITQNSTPTLISVDVNPTSICQGESITFTGTATDATFINWYDVPSVGISLGNSTSGANFVYTPATSGTHTYYAAAGIGPTGTGCESARIPLVVTVSPYPTGAIVNNTGTSILNCGVTSINVTASGGDIYAWSSGLNPSSAENNLIFGGTHYVTITNSATGCSIVEQISLSQDTVHPTAVIINNTGDNLLTCLLTEISVTAFGSSIIEWSGGSSGNSAENTFDSPGVYYVTVKNPINGCTDTESITINQDITTANTQFTNNTGTYELNCSLPTISVTASGGDEYVWSGGITPNQYTNVFTLVGTYYITVTKWSNGCSIVDSIIITRPPVFVATLDIINPIQCYGDMATISITATGGTLPYSGVGTFEIPAGEYSNIITDINNCQSAISATFTQPPALLLNITRPSEIKCYGDETGILVANVAGGTGDYYYNWQNDSHNRTSTSKEIGNLPADNYHVTVKDDDNCTIVADYELTQPSKFTMDYTLEDVSCFGKNNGKLNIVANGGTTPYQYMLKSGAYTRHLQNYNDLRPGSYIILVEDENLCSVEANIIVQQPEQLDVEYKTSDISCIDAQNGAIEIRVQGGIAPYSYLFNNQLSTEPKFYNLQAGNYYVIISDSYNCSVVLNKVEINDNFENCLNIPDAITPNGDGTNDTWIIDGLEIFNEVQIMVFNRWGQKIYEGDKSTEPWNGLYKNKKVPTGTYLYVIYAENRKKFSGTLTVIY